MLPLATDHYLFNIIISYLESLNQWELKEISLPSANLIHDAKTLVPRSKLPCP